MQPTEPILEEDAVEVEGTPANDVIIAVVWVILPKYIGNPAGELRAKVPPEIEER